MAVKFIVLALAVASASATCYSTFQQDDIFRSCGGSSQAVTVEAPRIELVQSAPRVELVQSAPRVELVQSSSPMVELLQGSQSVELAGSQVASTGPQVCRSLPVVQAPPVTLNAIESPIIRLPSPPVPAPRVIRHQCYCTKTVVRPQVVQRTVTVPRIQRYLRQSYKPVVESVSYQARPVGSDCSGEDIVISGSTAQSSHSAQEIAIPVSSQGVSFPVATQEVAIPVRATEVVRAPVSIGIFQEGGDCQCQCEQSYPRCY